MTDEPVTQAECDASTTKPRIFISVPDDRHLDDRRRALKRAIIGFIAGKNFRPVGFEPEQWGLSLPKDLEGWSLERARRLMKQCDGALILALARTSLHIKTVENEAVQHESKVYVLPTPYNHVEGGLAVAQQLPVFILMEQAMEPSGIFYYGGGIKPSVIVADADEAWVTTEEFQQHFNAWAEIVRMRRDVFLGYCSKASAVAVEIRDYLETKGITVLDWARDFEPAGPSILEEIERAVNHCRCAIFLFTKDDELPDKATDKATFDALPRDNVLVEAGYFTQAYGKKRVAIVREMGAKMPADFGGIIYIPLENRSKLSQVKTALVTFLTKALARQPSVIDPSPTTIPPLPMPEPKE